MSFLNVLNTSDFYTSCENLKSVSGDKNRATFNEFKSVYNRISALLGVFNLLIKINLV